MKISIERILFALISTIYVVVILSYLGNIYLGVHSLLFITGCKPCPVNEPCAAMCVSTYDLNWYGFVIMVVFFGTFYTIYAQLQKKKLPVQKITVGLWSIFTVIVLGMMYYLLWKNSCGYIGQRGYAQIYRCHSFWNPFSWNEDLNTLR